MEDNEDAESTKSEVKLGKLQFSLDYDFQKGEVRLSSVPGGMLFTVIAVENAKHSKKNHLKTTWAIKTTPS